MTTILVAVDFSPNAHWATDYALKLASQVKGRLVLVHAYDPFPNVTMPPDWMIPKAQEYYEQALQQLTALRDKLLEATNFPVDISIVTQPGSPTRCLIEEAANQKADLLVMGLAGSEPLKARRLGSLATDMIPYTKVPMLLIPPGVVYHKPQSIVLAVDLANPVNAQALSGAEQFAQLVDAKLDIICMADEPGRQLRKAAQRLQQLLPNQPHSFRFLSGNDLSVVLDNYLAEHDIDLIMLLPKPHNWLRTLLLESDTQEVARLATVPVLAAV